MFGYAPKILRIDVGEQRFRWEHVDESLYRLYMGGSCLAAHVLLTELPPGIDPFSPKNLLVFSAGVVTGAPVSGSSILSVVSKSPLTGGIHEAPTPGHMGENMKKAGYDVIILHGRSPKPVYLLVEEKGVQFFDALDLWGMSTAEAFDAIKMKVGSDVSVCTIGIAGEKLVRYSSIVHDYMFNTSRGGLGAVMGSKLVKGMAVRGETGPVFYDSYRLDMYAKRFREHFLENPVSRGHYEGGGHAGFIERMSSEGILSAKNARYTGFQGAHSVDGGLWRRNTDMKTCPVPTASEGARECIKKSFPVWSSAMAPPSWKRSVRSRSVLKSKIQSSLSKPVTSLRVMALTERPQGSWSLLRTSARKRGFFEEMS